ncbi:MAG: hypothetical protein LAP61_23185 [Acidobacteriia bacterium]|nr:hypothetical protein [Terriglobia bacterium]
MNTKYGLRGAIVPPGPFKGKNESFASEGFPIEMEDGVIAIGFEDKADTDRAREIVWQYLEWFSAEHGVRHVADLNQSWEIKSNGTKAIGIEVSDTVKVTADIRVSQATIQGKAFIVTPAYDSAKLSTYSSLVEKSQRNPALAKALRYYSEEVLDDDRPLYGVYKALEELSHAVGGRGKLAQLANQPEKYVVDVMETTQLTRHARTPARQLLSNQECHARARLLIEAYAKSV